MNQGKTHFADDDTLVYIKSLEDQVAELTVKLQQNTAAWRNKLAASQSLLDEREKLLKIAEAANRVPISYHAQWPVYSELRDALKEWKK